MKSQFLRVQSYNRKSPSSNELLDLRNLVCFRGVWFFLNGWGGDRSSILSVIFDVMWLCTAREVPVFSTPKASMVLILLENLVNIIHKWYWFDFPRNKFKRNLKHATNGNPSALSTWVNKIKTKAKNASYSFIKPALSYTLNQNFPIALGAFTAIFTNSFRISPRRALKMHFVIYSMRST